MNIETERLIIKPLTLDDARRFSEYRDKEEVAMYQSWDEYPLNKAINRIEYCQKHPFHGQIGNYQFGLYLKENNRLIGDIFIESIKLLERNGFDKIHKSWFYQDVLYRKMLNK